MYFAMMVSTLKVGRAYRVVAGATVSASVLALSLHARGDTPLLVAPLADPILARRLEETHVTVTFSRFFPQLL